MSRLPDLVLRETATAMIAAGFTDFDEYSEWLRLDGARQLRLIAGDVTDRKREMLDRLRERLQPEAACAVAERDAAA